MRPALAGLWAGTLGALVLGGLAAAQEAATYRLEVVFTWSEATHPHNWPEGGGHMTGLVGASHHARYVMFQDGRTASSGVRVVAENGRPAILLAELAEAKRRGRVGAAFQTGGVKSVPGQVQTTVKVSQRHYQISFVTMIAPSPDWFTGVAGVTLYADGVWADQIDVPLWPWDAGTDSGAEYRSANAETQPAQSIRLLATPHFLKPSGLAPIGTARFTRIDAE